MALSKCLCPILILGMLGLRPSADLRTGSPDPGPWWGTPQAQELRDQAQQARAAANFTAAEQIYRREYEQATRLHDRVSGVRILTALAGALFGQSQYRAALAVYLDARRKALEAGDLLDAGAIDLNLSSLYLQVWDFSAAMKAAERSLGMLPYLRKPYFEAALLVHLARLHEIAGDGDAAEYYFRGIEAARRTGNPALEAMGWHYIGAGRLHAGDLKSAERALTEAFRLRSLFDRAELLSSWALLGQLKLEQGEFATAALLTERAISAARLAATRYPLYLLIHQRGEIRQARGESRQARADFAEAVKLTARWQQEVPPTISALAAANIELEKRVFDSFIEAAAERAIGSRDPQMLAASLAAVDLNRAWSLRQTVAIAGGRKAKLAAEYWQLQAKLRAESVRPMSRGLARSSELEQIELRLSEMEAETKLPVSTNKPEKIRTQIPLIDFQKGLSESEVVLVFHLGRKTSYLWAVTREHASIHRLPGAGELRPEVERFRDVVRGGGHDAKQLGFDLYRRLFGGLPRRTAEKPDWLLSVDDALFDLPFAALVTASGGDWKYLVEGHSLEEIPGALPVTSARGRPKANGWFLGVGDPIYNLADARLKRGPFRGWWAIAAHPAADLNRLPGSAVEIESSARAWSNRSVLLSGAEAIRSRFLELARTGPAIVHLATHVLIPPGRRGDAMIALGLSADRTGEFLTVSDVAAIDVAGALVVMSGCETGAGDIQAGAGLLGLTRAWQAAGASAVVSTGWPVPDSSGAMFSSFYSHLRDLAPAQALRRSQMEMFRSGGWRAAPSSWAAYQVSGGVQ